MTERQKEQPMGDYSDCEDERDERFWRSWDAVSSEPEHRLWVSPSRLTLIRWWEDGTVEVCRREHPDAIWGPEEVLEEER